jgi:hypothetical protein
MLDESRVLTSSLSGEETLQRPFLVKNSVLLMVYYSEFGLIPLVLPVADRTALGIRAPRLNDSITNIKTMENLRKVLNSLSQRRAGPDWDS